MERLFDRLNKYGDSDYYGFHMPGHKRNLKLVPSAAPYKIDITEIEGFDDLHHASGILLEAQERAAEVFGAGETHFLINGSTAGILSAVSGAVKKGDTVLVARNCHKSVYHALYLNELQPVYLYPGFSDEAWLNTGISSGDVEEALDSFPDIKAVIIVSPTYDGAVSDVDAIAACVHRRGIPLIVDEAHGAHFGFDPYFPNNSNNRGADVVIHSLHKTLPALTQTALLHINGNIVNKGRIREYLHMLQTSSPSYVLMSSIDSCIDLLQNYREKLFPPYVSMLKKARMRLAGLKYLGLVKTEEHDCSKLVISVKAAGMTGKELYNILLRDYHLQMEMAAGSYVLAMTSIADVQEGMDRLVEALLEIDRRTGGQVRDGEITMPGNAGLQEPVYHGAMRSIPRQECVYRSAVMALMREEAVETGRTADYIKVLPWDKSVGYVSTEYAYLYPPGCPLIVPGEKVSQEAVYMLQWYQKHSFDIEGLKKEEHIEVWTDGQDILYDGKELFR